MQKPAPTPFISGTASNGMMEKKFTADDVKFTIEAIMDPENGSENAPNYEDVEEITVIDDSTVSFRPFRAERGFPGIHDDGHPAEAPAGR